MICSLPDPLAHTAGNTPNGERQHVHIDAWGIYIDNPYAIATNICLCDVSPANGSTEWWPGTHVAPRRKHCTDENPSQVRQELLEERRKTDPPVYPTFSKGSIVLRDLRIW